MIWALGRSNNECHEYLGNKVDHNKKWQRGKLYTVKYFERIGVSAETVYMIMKECDEGRPMQRKPGSGRPPKKMKERETRAMIHYHSGTVGVSQR